MTNELTIMQHELQIAKQDAEIMRLKYELQKVQAEKTSRLEDSLFSPALFPHYEKVSEKLAKSGVVPTAYRNKPEDIFVAIAMGYQLGFPVEQSLQDIAVINGRPCLWGDGLLSLALNHKECEYIKEEPIFKENHVFGYICVVKRKGHEEHCKKFTLEDAKLAGLLGKQGPWTQYPERMMQMRARSLALRDKFADALRGLRIAEVEEDEPNTVEGVIIDNSTTVKQVDKLKEMLHSSNANPEKIKKKKEEEKISDIPISIQPKSIHNSGSDSEKASEDQKNEIDFLMMELKFDEERRKKAFDYFKIQALDDLTDAQARVFLVQLGKKT